MTSTLFVGTHENTTDPARRTRERQIKVSPDGEGRYQVEIDGKVHSVDARRFGGGTWSVLIDHESYDVELEVAGAKESEGRYNALVRGRLVRLGIKDERALRMGLGQGKFEVTGPQTLASPMPGRVVKVLVGVGQGVTEGQPLVIVEAMKMENELRSPKAGTVTSVMIKEGQGVEGGTKLLVVE